MKKEQSRIEEVYKKLQTWLEETKESEVRSIAELLEQAKTILIAAEQIPEQKVKQFIARFFHIWRIPHHLHNDKYVLSNFILQNRN